MRTPVRNVDSIRMRWSVNGLGAKSNSQAKSSRVRSQFPFPELLQAEEPPRLLYFASPPSRARTRNADRLHVRSDFTSHYYWGTSNTIVSIPHSQHPTRHTIMRPTQLLRSGGGKIPYVPPFPLPPFPTAYENMATVAIAIPPAIG